MCGICGFVTLDSDCRLEEAALRRMTATLVHRGPDDEGFYLDQQAAFGMRRLSIIDLVSGQQPQANESGDVWVVYNGEIYNFREVRADLEKRGHVFSTQSDTEVIVHAYEEFGENCPAHFNGMFALAVWDARSKRLFMARDRLGIKPLYYWLGKDRLVFGSELKALMAHPRLPREIDPVALDHFLTLEYIPAPRSILRNVNKLPPGHTLMYQNGRVEVQPYWKIPHDPVREDLSTSAERLRELIRDAVRIRLMSDVPLGAFLSGGIDSSTIVACMSQTSSEPVQTFSIGFEDDTYNELPYARAVAARFNTQHREKVLTPDIEDLAVRLARHLDEPFADTSIFSTFLVSQLASESVKVVLSGDGGDELFAGYDTYLAQAYSRITDRLPAPVRERALPALMGLVPPQPAKKGLVNKTKRMIEGAALPKSLRHTRWMIFLNSMDKLALYHPDFAASVNGDSAEKFLQAAFQRANVFDGLAQQQYVDIHTYLPDDILTKVDRMSMAVSIEARVPLLDYRIVEFALNLPAEYKLSGSRTKIILREAVREWLPPEVLSKPKQGFSIPMKHWLRGSLRTMMMDLLAENSLRTAGYFQPAIVAKWQRQHLDGRVNHSHRLWPLMVFEMWRRVNLT